MENLSDNGMDTLLIQNIEVLLQLLKLKFCNSDSGKKEIFLKLKNQISECATLENDEQIKVYLNEIKSKYNIDC